MEGDDCEFHYGGRTSRFGLGEREGMGEVKKNWGFLFLSNW